MYQEYYLNIFQAYHEFSTFYGHNRVVHKVPKMGLLGPSFAKSKMGSQDENSAHRGKTGDETSFLS